MHKIRVIRNILGRWIQEDVEPKWFSVLVGEIETGAVRIVYIT